MKENIEKRLNRYAETLINKDELFMEEINFFVFLVEQNRSKGGN